MRRNLPFSVRNRLAGTDAFGAFELLVTAAIVVALICLAIPVAQKASESAKQTQCVGNLRQLHQALVTYAADRHGKMPWGQDGRDSAKNWLTYLREGGYIPNQRYSERTSTLVNLCPATTVRASDGKAHDHLGSYGINRGIAGNVMVSSNGAESVTPQVSIQNIVSPSTKILLLDSGMPLAYSSLFSRPAAPRSYLPGLKANEPVGWDDSVRADALKGRHGGRVNVLMADGHAERWKDAEFQTLGPTAWNPTTTVP